MRILVQPGHYQDFLPIPSGLRLEIVGEGQEGDVVVSFVGGPVIVWGDPLTAKSPSAPRLEKVNLEKDEEKLPVGHGNLKLRNLTIQNTIGPPPFLIPYLVSPHIPPSTFAIDVFAPNFFLEHCIVTSKSHGCLRSMGPVANIHIRKSTLEGGKCSTVVVGSGSSAVIDSSTLCGNVHDKAPFASGIHAVEVCGGATCILRRTNIHTTKADGVLAFGEGTKLLCSKSNIEGCGGNGIEVREKASATIDSCVVWKNRESGLCVHSQGIVTSDHDVYKVKKSTLRTS